jgi:hypothetical protein
MDRYHNALAKLSSAADALGASFDELNAVLGDDGQPLVDARDVDNQVCTNLRVTLARIDEHLVVWRLTFRKKVSGAASPAISRHIPDAGSDEEDEIDDAVTEWDRSNAS